MNYTRPAPDEMYVVFSDGARMKTSKTYFTFAERSTEFSRFPFAYLFVVEVSREIRIAYLYLEFFKIKTGLHILFDKFSR
jgi:hypothetical protein